MTFLFVGHVVWPLLVFLPFSLVAGLDLALRGGQFVALLQAAFVSVLVTIGLAVLWQLTIPHADLFGAMMPTLWAARLVLWPPEIVIAAAFWLQAYIHRNASWAPRAWLYGIAMAASAEALLFLVEAARASVALHSPGQFVLPQLFAMVLVGAVGVMILILPGYIVGGVVRILNGEATPRFAWLIWPIWMLGSAALRLYGPTIVR